MRKVLLFCIFLACIVTVSAEVKDLEAGAIISDLPVKYQVNYVNFIIQEKNMNWTAGETSVSGLSDEAKQALLMQYPPSIVGEELQVPKSDYPSSVDWRDKDKENWVTPVKNQGNCGSCWAFSVLGAVESSAKIALNDSSYDIDLSEQDLVSCSGTGSCNGLSLNKFNLPFEYAKNTGIVKENCFSYQGCRVYNKNTGTCMEEWPCSKCNEDKVKVLNYNLIEASADTVRQAVSKYGPVTVYMGVYEDFYLYKGGIYKYVWGNFLGYHAISIVGYNNNAKYWICKNSWGTGWGKSGFFKINYSEDILDFKYWNPKMPGEFFLDGSYVVTSTDVDEDSIEDRIDNCPLVKNTQQEDLDLDDIGNVCDADLDGDELNNSLDNCVWINNPDQKDSDSDGFGNLCDVIFGSVNDTENNFASLNFSIDGSSTFNQNLTGNKTINFADELGTILSFNWDFSNIFYFNNLTILKQESDSNGSILIRGLDILKTVYFDKVSSQANRICVKDKEILSISEISENCTAVDEFSLACPGTNGSYSCELVDSKYKVDGLSHSGAKEYYLAPTCGNRIIEDSEECDDSNLSGQTCTTKGYTGGTLSCSACLFDISACTSGGGGGGRSGGGGGSNTKSTSTISTATEKVVTEEPKEETVIEEPEVIDNKITGAATTNTPQTIGLLAGIGAIILGAVGMFLYFKFKK